MQAGLACTCALSQELYITFVHQTRYQEISPPVAFSSSRAGAWCVGRGGAKGSMAARKRGRRTSDRGVAARELVDGLGGGKSADRGATYRNSASMC